MNKAVNREIVGAFLVFPTIIRKRLVNSYKKIFKTISYVIRILYNCRTDTYEDLLRHTKSPSLYIRRLQEIVILMYKVRNGLAPGYIGEL